MNKYILDNNIFDHLLLLTDSQLQILASSGEYFVVSNVKNHELDGLREKAPGNDEKLKNIFLLLKVQTLPNHHLPWLEENPWGENMHPFKNNTNAVFGEIKGMTIGDNGLHDALIGDAASQAGYIVITEDSNFTKRLKRSSVGVLNWHDFSQKVGNF